MSDTTIYQYARVSATIGAGIFTGLTLSAPLYALPATSAFSLFQTAQQKQYSTEKQKLSPSDRLTLFKTIHHTTGAVAIPVAVISGALYGVAAYFTPVSFLVHPFLFAVSDVLTRLFHLSFELLTTRVSLVAGLERLEPALSQTL